MPKGENLTPIYVDGHTTVDAVEDVLIRVEDHQEADQAITLPTGQAAGGKGRLARLAWGNAPHRGTS